MNTLTKQQLEELNQLAMLPDEAIDTSDIPEQINWDNAVRGRFYVAENVALEPDILAWFKAKNGQRYQQMINETLRDYIQHAN
jgi:uncharacterized protein (DUF4415 family)